MSAEALAHSARPAQGIGPQTYRKHVGNVADGSQVRVGAMLRHYSPDEGSPSSETLRNIVACAAEFHDLGKLDPGFQKTLRENRTSDDHIRHEDAGSAWLIRESQRLGNPALLEAAAFVASHHQGLVRYRVEDADYFASGGETIELDVEGFRIQDAKTREATERRLENYVSQHRNQIDASPLPISDKKLEISGLTRRLLLSCLVDADHSDTARHYQNEREIGSPAPRWKDRLEKLEFHVSGLPKPNRRYATESELRRQEIRDQLFQLCRDADTEPKLLSCDAVVGSGKTTALMAHLLQIAITRNLRHIIVVLPFTNIITQSVEVYRKALCLDDENPEEVVAEHHHQVEFKSPDIRHLTTSWRAPIIVTTAVQFFETLAANNTARLRKLHELPGSAVFLDETHAALPASLWPVCWNWLTQWTRRWNGHLVLVSGSLPEFWKMPEFVSLCEGRSLGEIAKKPAINVPSLAPNLKSMAEEAEHRRVKFISEDKPLNVDELADRITDAKGPRIVVVNTVQSAAFLASYLHNQGKTKILHLSTALTPAHRFIIVQRIKNLLKYQADWILVATSLVEAGMDFSFFSGFRQRASAASLIQLGGRVNRSAKWKDEPFVLDFTFKEDERFPDNPSLKPSQEALESLFRQKIISADTPCDLSAICLAAMKAEFRAGTQATAANLINLENEENYPELAKQCRVIRSDTRTIIVDPDIVKRIKNRETVSSLEVSRNSIQMYHTKIEKFRFTPLRPDLDIYQLPESWDYDSDFLGYMADAVRRNESAIPSGYYP